MRLCFQPLLYAFNLINMGHVEEEELKVEIQHIFDSGANEIRILEMVKSFINRRKSYTERQMDDAYDKGFKDAMVKYRKD